MQSKSKEEFLEKVSEIFDVTAKINNAKRSIIKKRIALNAAPLYTLGYMSLSKQYSTFGVVKFIINCAYKHNSSLNETSRGFSNSAAGKTTIKMTWSNNYLK